MANASRQVDSTGFYGGAGCSTASSHWDGEFVGCLTGNPGSGSSGDAHFRGGSDFRFFSFQKWKQIEGGLYYIEMKIYFSTIVTETVQKPLPNLDFN